MKATIAIYYFLILILVVGAFASMAQNDYGMQIIGYTCVAFAVSFFYSSVKIIRYQGFKRQTILSIIELVSLIIIAIIFSLRVFFIRFPFIELVFAIAGLAIMVRFSFLVVNIVKTTWNENRLLCVYSTFFYLSIIFYTSSMVIVIINPAFSEPLGGLGFGFLLLYLGGGLYYRNLFYKGEKYSALNYLNRFSTKSILMMAVYVLFTMYMGLTKFDLIPKLYSSEYPQAYLKLVNEAESGKEKPVEGKFKHEKFKAKYDEFVEKSKSN